MAFTELTDQEVAILKASLSMSDAQLCESTGLARQTVRNIRRDVYRRMGVSGPKALWQVAEKMGWVKVQS